MSGARVYVGGLPYDVRERDLERFFKGYGRITEILIKKGYGFVEFEDYRDADDAVYEMNGKKLLGERVTIEPARGTARGSGSRRDRERRGGRSRFGPPLRTKHRLIVENLSSRISWQDLKDYMRQAGEVTYADAHRDRKNEGVVEFATASEMKAAIKQLDDTELNGRRIRLQEDRGGRGGGGGRGGRSRSRSDSRSRSPSRRRSRSASRSRSRSRSRSKSRSQSKNGRKSRSQKRDRDASRSRSRDADHKSKSRSKSRDRTRDERRSRSHSGKPEKSRSRSASRSRSKDKKPERSQSRDRVDRSRSRSRSRSKSKDARSRSRSRSYSRSRSRSRDSRSRSPDNRGRSRSASAGNNDQSMED
ncbi:serine-arginine protein 55 [Aedes albopictus]|uniref:RRM domain-containing protein n=1 Tax=Aedes albopictus TaxID=7160 RepID=A0ABM1Y113_AEDAL|nr:serine-arginine protein 55 [Aedes albopictus]KXJ80159.1 hypothetical protein RP20_CCG026419 [Aedes albopictus]